MITVATYNVLAAAYVRPKFYPLVDKTHFPTEVRYPRIVERVTGLGADVICLQEVDQQLFSLLDSSLNCHGYGGLWAPKLGAKPDGCATFIRPPWKMVLITAFHYNDDVPGRKRSGHVIQSTIVEKDGVQLKIMNTHLKWHPPDAGPDDRFGLIQARGLINWSSRWPSEAVVCGDLNVEPDSDVLDAFRNAGYAESDKGLAKTFNSNSGAKKLDYLLHSSGLRAMLRPVPLIDDKTPLPSETEPSDHVPLVATFRFKE